MLLRLLVDFYLAIFSKGLAAFKFGETLFVVMRPMKLYLLFLLSS